MQGMGCGIGKDGAKQFALKATSTPAETCIGLEALLSLGAEQKLEESRSTQW